MSWELVKTCTVVIASSEDGRIWGTGFFISPDGHLLTCAHVVEDAGGWEQVRVNGQPVRLVYLGDEEKELKAQISQLPGLDDWVGKTPHLLVFCADLRRGWRITESKGLVNENNTLDMLVNATRDAAIAMMSLIVAAESLGLGCCPISVVRNQIEQVSAWLKLPTGVYPFAGLGLGYPADEGKTTIRLPQSVVVHRNHYDDSHLLEQLHTYDNTRHGLTPIPTEKQLHPERYGIQPNLKWTDNVACRLSVRERRTFRALLEQQNLALE
jgi:nitroreductase/FMN reductase [NAD(P)H]